MRRLHLHCLCFVASILLYALCFQYSAFAQATICARVKIEILQELTLERQAFEARMVINNGLAGVPLTGLGVSVSFADANGNSVRASSDPNDLTAKFFIRLQTGSTIPATIPGDTSSTITWLIIPAPGSANANPNGTQYSVGATLSYNAAGVSNSVAVSPDTIYVKPMPNLTLDYFLPSEVYGDDPFTDNIEEPVVPFNLGVRVKNTGYGAARRLAIESAQPRIIENKQGLLVNFRIEGSEVNGQPATASLLANFGDIPANRSGVARWIMTSTLSGRFLDFTANYTHSDELGGQLTSLLAGQPRTHLLLRDVLVDLPGRDGVRDFLAQDGNVIRVYESENADTVVADLSGTAGLTSQGGGSYRLTTAPSSGFVFYKKPDPLGGQQALRSATRADGKNLNLANAWLSKTWDNEARQWNYFVNVFDANNTAGAAYTLQFETPPPASNRPPVLNPISDWTLSAGNYLSFPLTGSDPDGNSLTYAFASAPPSGATLDPVTGLFRWQPAQAQAPSTNVIQVQVTDNGSPNLSATRSFTVVVKGNTAPELAAIPGFYANVLESLRFTNSVTDEDLPANNFLFTLEAGAPIGAQVNATNGIFTWTPQRDQSPSTNLITVTVTDDGLPPLSDSKSFVVIVNDYLELTLGSAIVRAGEAGSISLQSFSSAPLSNLTFTLNFPNGNLTNLLLEPLTPITAIGYVTNENQLVLSFTPPGGQTLSSNVSLGQISFTAISPQISTFLPISVESASGLRDDGSEVPRNLFNNGEVVVLGQASLLRAYLSSNGERYLMLYGLPGTNYTIDYVGALDEPLEWTGFRSVTLSNLAQPISNLNNTNGMIFYRARQ